MRFGTAIERLVDNYQYAKSKIWIRDEVAWALYHTWKEADDRKTENCSEKPNNCEVKNYCDDCLYTDTCDSKAFFYACTSKATISKMEQVEPQTELVRVKYHCINCAENGSYKCSKCDGEMYYKYDKDEPQTKCYLRTSCDHYEDKQVCGRCREYNLYSHTKTEPQTERSE